MKYKVLEDKDWLNAAVLIRKTIAKDKDSYKLLFHIFWITSVVMIFVFWPVTILTIPASFAFLYYSKVNVILYLSHLVIENKQLIETKLDYGEDSGDISEEDKTIKQYHLDCKSMTTYEVESDRLKEINKKDIRFLIVDQMIFDEIEKGDEIDVIICSTNNLYAYNIESQVKFFISNAKNTTNGSNLTFIDQQKHLRSNMPKFN